MALESEVTQVLGRIPGGAQVSAGSYWNTRTMCITQTTSDTTLPAMDWWHLINNELTGTATLSSCATKINTLMNALSPVTGNYAYTSASFHSYTSADLPATAVGQGKGASDA